VLADEILEGHGRGGGLDPTRPPQSLDLLKLLLKAILLVQANVIKRRMWCRPQKKDVGRNRYLPPGLLR